MKIMKNFTKIVITLTLLGSTALSFKYEEFSKSFPLIAKTGIQALMQLEIRDRRANQKQKQE